MKAVNEGMMLVAQALEKLKLLKEPEYVNFGMDTVGEAIVLLESAVEKLVENI